MGAFILGILVGWLLEWLFFSFWIKGRSTGPFAGVGDSSALKSELASKDSEIASLKQQLVDQKASSEAAIEAASTKANNATTDSGVQAEAVASSASTTTDKASAGRDKKSAVKATATTPKTTSAPAKKAATSKKTATAKKAPAKKAATPAKKTSSAKKSTATAKTATAKKATKAKSSSKKAAIVGDDLTKLSGIGPSMAATLKELGIDSFSKLAAMDDDILRDMLEASGARLNNNKEAMDTWNEQAELAAKGDFEGLKKLQESLKKR